MATKIVNNLTLIRDLMAENKVNTIRILKLEHQLSGHCRQDLHGPECITCSTYDTQRKLATDDWLRQRREYGL